MMYLTHLAIILQLTGAIDLVAGFVFMLLAPQERLLTGLVLGLIGSSVFLLGRFVLKVSRQRRPIAMASYKELHQQQPVSQEAYAVSVQARGGPLRG